MFSRSSSILLSLILCLSFASKTMAIYDPAQEISFSEIRSLYDLEPLPENLEKKVEKLTKTPQLVPVPAGKVSTSFKNHPEHGKYFRVANWNIEKGQTLDTIKTLYNDPDKFLQDNLDEEDYLKKTERYEDIKEEIELLNSAELLVLTEADYGISRTGYRNVTKELAETIGAGYVYLPEFVEIDPKLIDDPNLDKTRYKGLHGNALISKYPIKEAKAYELPRCYDWYNKEKEQLTRLERMRRYGSKIVFDEHIVPEIRRGYRNVMIVDLEMPNKETLTVVNTHMEDKARPDCRVAQGKYILTLIKHKKNPVILTGDLNTFEHDLTPTSIGRILKSKFRDPAFVFRTIGSSFTPFGFIIYPSITLTNITRKFKDPSAKNLPFVMPNKISGFFTQLRNFRFDDGLGFDFSGTDKWTHNAHNTGFLSNSNQRWLKGYVETTELERSFKVIRFKTDWFFVKPTGSKENKKYFPAFGRTLKKLNYSYTHNGGRIVDHTPMVVDIMLSESN